MSFLKNLESKLEQLIEGGFKTAFKSEVQPIELARKLARKRPQVHAVVRKMHRLHRARIDPRPHDMAMLAPVLDMKNDRAGLPR